jgi:hypothetical protein
VRENAKELNKQYDKSENDLKALQSVGQVCIVNMCVKNITLKKFKTKGCKLIYLLKLMNV